LRRERDFHAQVWAPVEHARYVLQPENPGAAIGQFQVARTPSKSATAVVQGVVSTLDLVLRHSTIWPSIQILPSRFSSEGLGHADDPVSFKQR
jgi:hypothetical protein